MNWSNPDAVTIQQVLDEALAVDPNRRFLDIAGEQFTLSDIEIGSNRISHGLIEIGIGRGDRVCAVLDTSIDLIFLWFAVTKIGAVFVPINTAFKGEFLRHQISDTGARLAIVDTHYADRVLAIETQLPALEHLLYRGEPLTATSQLKLGSIDDLRSPNEGRPDLTLAPGDLAALIYTSGTTGPSKGCMLSHNAMANSAFPTLTAQKLKAGDRLWLALPLFHMLAVGSMLACMRMGVTYILSPRFSVSGFWPEIERSGATAMLGLANMFSLLVDAPETPEEKRCHGQIRSVFGAPFLRELQEHWKRRFGVVHAASAGYAMTECCPIAGHADREMPPTAAGVPHDYLDVRIFAHDACEASPGEIGEIVVRPKIPHVMFSGYWNRPDGTAEVLRNTWFHTGDIGKIDAEGTLYFVDRKKDYMRSRGENISSFELERAFRTHSAVADVAVHSVPSQSSEDDIKATIVLKPEASVSEEDICRWSIDQLPYFAVPRYFEFREDLPRNAVGRVLKFELRDEGVTIATWDREAAGIRVGR